MRYQKAKQLAKIVRLLISDDYELILTGATFLKEHHIVKNLNKHYKEKVDGFKISCPMKFRTVLDRNLIFHKGIVNRILTYKENDEGLIRDCYITVSWLLCRTSYFWNYCRDYTNLLQDVLDNKDIPEHAEDFQSIVQCIDKDKRRIK